MKEPLCERGNGSSFYTVHRLCFSWQPLLELCRNTVAVIIIGISSFAGTAVGQFFDFFDRQTANVAVKKEQIAGVAAVVEVKARPGGLGAECVALKTGSRVNTVDKKEKFGRIIDLVGRPDLDDDAAVFIEPVSAVEAHGFQHPVGTVFVVGGAIVEFVGKKVAALKTVGWPGRAERRVDKGLIRSITHVVIIAHPADIPIAQ